MTENFLHQAIKVDAELFHSNMLAFLWQRYPALANEHLSDGFLREEELIFSDEIHRERYNIDILLSSTTKILGIENKLKSRHTSEQLGRYLDIIEKAFKSKESRMIALCLTENDRKQTKERLNNIYSTSFISYEEHVLPFLRCAIDDAMQQADSKSIFYLNDYLEVLEQMLFAVKRYENNSSCFGEMIKRIHTDVELTRFRLAPLVHRRIFEHIHLAFTSELRDSGERDAFEVSDVCIAGRSKKGQITSWLSTFKTIATFNLYVGIQLEGAQLRRCVRFERQDGKPISMEDKNVIHERADKLERDLDFFSGCSKGLLTPEKQVQHFRGTHDLMPFLAYKNSSSEFFLYRAVIFEETSQSLTDVGSRLAKEMMRIKNLVATLP